MKRFKDWMGCLQLLECIAITIKMNQPVNFVFPIHTRAMPLLGLQCLLFIIILVTIFLVGGVPICKCVFRQHYILGPYRIYKQHVNIHYLSNKKLWTKKVIITFSKPPQVQALPKCPTNKMYQLLCNPIQTILSRLTN